MVPIQLKTIVEDRFIIFSPVSGRMKQSQLERERRKHETKKDGEEIQRLQELHQWEQKMEEQSQARQKKEFMNDQLVGGLT